MQHAPKIGFYCRQIFSGSISRQRQNAPEWLPALGTPYDPLSSLASNSSFVLCFLSAATRVSIASIGFKSTIVRRNLRTASSCLAGKSFSSLRVPDFGNVNGRKQPPVGKLSVEDQLHVARALEFLKNQFVHARPGINQRRRQNRKRSAVLNLAGRCEHLARNFQRARIHAAGHRSSAAAMHAVVRAGDARQRIHQNKNVLARSPPSAGTAQS